MQNTIKISCVIGTTDDLATLGLEIWLNDQKLFDQNHVVGKQVFEHEMSDDEAEYELRFVMKNKTADHTKIDETGAIVKDACLTIDELAFDELLLGQLVTEKTVYTHSFNGTENTVQDKFYGTMGCNGTVSLKFFTPMYLWLLENM